MRNEELYKKIKSNWDNLSKPLDGLGEFETVLSRIGAIQGSENIALFPSTLLIFIADNGIIEEGVSQSGSDVTYEVAKALGKSISTVCHMAKSVGMNIKNVNVGIKEKGEIEGVENRRVAYGTNNFLIEPAMSEGDMNKAIEIGKECVYKLKEEGNKVIALGEMGIGNTTTSAAVLAGLCKISADKVCSRGAGLSDEGLLRKIKVVDEAIKKYDLYNLPPKEILRCVGGFDIAALMGVYLMASTLHVPIISDGFITSVAALLAKRIDDSVKDIVFFSHNAKENGIKYILDEFEAKPVINANMALGEGTGTCIFMAAAKCALSVYEGGTHFEDINVNKYERFV